MSLTHKRLGKDKVNRGVGKSQTDPLKIKRGNEKHKLGSLGTFTWIITKENTGRSPGTKITYIN